MKRLESPNSCCLSLYWCQMLCGLFELPWRLAHHFCCFAISYPCSLDGREDSEESLCALHNMAHAFIANAYWSLTQVLFFNLCNPCSPWYAYWDDVSLERPSKPQPPTGGNARVQEGAKEASQGGVCPCCSPKDCCNFQMDHTNRLFRSAFCALSCYHSCHPALICGPLCTEPGCCVCCEGWHARINRWGREAKEAKERRTNEFYAKTGRVRVPGASSEPAQAHAVGKPQQMAMV